MAPLPVNCSHESRGGYRRLTLPRPAGQAIFRYLDPSGVGVLSGASQLERAVGMVGGAMGKLLTEREQRNAFRSLDKVGPPLIIASSAHHIHSCCKSLPLTMAQRRTCL